jgi:hypothetical protein
MDQTERYARGAARLAAMAAAICLMGVAPPARADDGSGDEASEEAAPLLSPYITPTLGVFAGVAWQNQLLGDAAPRRQGFYSLWLGLNAFPFPDEHAEFFTLGVEIEPHRSKYYDSTTVYVMPTMRAGYAALGCASDGDDVEWVDSFLPCVSLYGLMGFRPPSPFRSFGTRVGLGISSPFIMLAATQGNILLPSTLEVVGELGLDGSVTTFLRMGFTL